MALRAAFPFPSRCCCCLCVVRWRFGKLDRQLGCLAAVSVISGCVLWAHFGWLITHVNQDSKQRRHAVNPCVMAAEVVAIGVGQQVRLIVRPRRQTVPKGAKRDSRAAEQPSELKWNEKEKKTQKKNLLPQRCTWQYLLLLLWLLLLLMLDWCALYVNWAVVFAVDALSRDNQQQQQQPQQPAWRRTSTSTHATKGTTSTTATHYADA